MSKENCRRKYLFLQKSTKTGSKVALIPALCKSWSCPVCRKRKSEQVRSYIKKHFIGQNAWMITITFFHSGEPLDAWKKIGKSINRLLTYARKYSGKFDYVRVVEPHKDGSWPHMHMIVNKHLATPNFVKLVTNWGFGWNFEEQPMSGEKAANYMSKYLTKPWPEGDADLLRQISKTRIVSNSRSLGPIFTKPSTWTAINLTRPIFQVPQSASAVLNEVHKNGATEVKYTPISDGWIIEADAELSPEFVECIEDLFRTDDLQRHHFAYMKVCHQNAVPF